MSDPTLTLVVVVAAIAVSLGSAAIFRRVERRRVRRVPLDLTVITGAVTLFSDAGCARCDLAREALISAGAEFEEIRFDHHRDLVEAVGVTGVPVIVARAPDGTELDRIVGKPSRRALRRLLARVG
jgi:glutaredoxin